MLDIPFRLIAVVMFIDDSIAFSTFNEKFKTFEDCAKVAPIEMPKFTESVLKRMGDNSDDIKTIDGYCLPEGQLPDVIPPEPPQRPLTPPVKSDSI